MKKITTILTLLLITVTSASAESFDVLNENTTYSKYGAWISWSTVHTYSNLSGKKVNSAGTISFTATAQAASSSWDLYVEYSTDNQSTWTTLGSVTMTYTDRDFSLDGLPSYITDVRFRFKGSLQRWVKNVVIKGASEMNVTYDAGGSVSPAYQTKSFGENFGDMPIPDNDGRFFVGWYYGDTKITSDTKYTFTEDITLKAKYNEYVYNYVNERDMSVVYSSSGNASDAPALDWFGWSEVKREVGNHVVTIVMKNDLEGKKFLIKKDNLYLDMTNLTNQNDGDVTTAVTFTETGTPVELAYTSNGCCIKYKDTFLTHNMNGANKGWTCTATNTEDYWIVNGTETDFTLSSTSYQDNTVKVEWNDAANAYQMFYDNNNDANTAHLQLEEVTANMKITDAKWGTFSAPFVVRIPDNVKAYIGEMQQGWIRMTEIQDVIPAYTGVVVTSDEPIDIQLGGVIAETVEQESCYTPNCDGSIITFSTTGDYLLQKNDEQVGWFIIEGNGFKLANNRCYLKSSDVLLAPDNAASRSFIGFKPIDDATGISNIAAEAAAKADGKYMVNGRIVVVKDGKAYSMNGQRI